MNTHDTQAEAKAIDPAMQVKIRLIVPHFCRQKFLIQHRIGSATIQHHLPSRQLPSHPQPWTR